MYTLTNKTKTYIKTKTKIKRKAHKNITRKHIRKSSKYIRNYKYGKTLKGGSLEEVLEILKDQREDDGLTIRFLTIDDLSANAIAEELKVNNKITNIFLTENTISDIGINHIASALKFNTSINVINISGNNISDVGANSIAEALIVNNTINTIILSNNYIGDKGTKAISEALKINSSITNINLSGNNITDIGASAIAEALKVNQSITNINLDDYNISIELTQLISALLKSKQNKLDNYDNNYNDKLKFYDNDLKDLKDLKEIEIPDAETEDYKSFVKVIVDNSIKNKANNKNSIATITTQNLIDSSFKNEATYNYIIRNNIEYSKLGYRLFRETAKIYYQKHNNSLRNLNIQPATKLLMVDLHGNTIPKLFKLPKNIHIIFMSSINYITYCPIEKLKNIINEYKYMLSRFLQNPSCFDKENENHLFQQAVVYYGGQYCTDLNLSRSHTDHVTGLSIYNKSKTDNNYKFVSIDKENVKNKLESLEKGEYSNSLSNFIKETIIPYSNSRNIILLLTSCRGIHTNTKIKDNLIFYEKIIKSINFKTSKQNQTQNQTLEGFIKCNMIKNKKNTNVITQVQFNIKHNNSLLKSKNSSIDYENFVIYYDKKKYKLNEIKNTLAKIDLISTNNLNKENVKNFQGTLFLENIKTNFLEINKKNYGYSNNSSTKLYRPHFDINNNKLLYIFNNNYIKTLNFLINSNYNLLYIEQLSNFITFNHLQKHTIKKEDLQEFNTLNFINDEIKINFEKYLKVTQKKIDIRENNLMLDLSNLKETDYILPTLLKNINIYVRESNFINKKFVVLDISNSSNNNNSFEKILNDSIFPNLLIVKHSNNINIDDLDENIKNTILFITEITTPINTHPTPPTNIISNTTSNTTYQLN